MPAQRVGLRMIKDVIRLKWDARLSHDKIATALGIFKGVVQKYVALAGAAKLDWDEVRDWDEQRLQQALLPASRPPSGFVEPDWARVTRTCSARASRSCCCGRSTPRSTLDFVPWRCTTSENAITSRMRLLPRTVPRKT